MIDPRRAIELAYGILWHLPTDLSTEEGKGISAARHALLDLLDRDGKKRGVFAAQQQLDSLRSRRLT
jgi:hypothetical protein